MGENGFYWDAANQCAMGRYLTVSEWTFIARNLAGQPGIRTVLDVGGGSGRFAVPLQQAGYRPLVLEVDTAPLQALARNGGSVGGALTNHRIEDWPVGSESVDCVLSIETPMLDEPAAFFAESRRVLRAGGLLIFTSHNWLSYKGAGKWLRNLGRERCHYGQTYRETLFGVRALLRAAGFAIVQEQGFNWVPAGRTSDSPIVSAAARLERALGLTRLAWLSPWVLVVARKTS